MRRSVVASLCLAMLVGIPGFAQERSSGAGGGAGKTRRATALIGASLTSRDGAALGKISDLVIDNRGHVDYVIVRHDTGYLAVPWAVVTGTGANLSVSVNVTREALRDVTFPDSNWPDFTSPRWTRAARTTWGEAALRGDRVGTGSGGAGVDTDSDSRRDLRLNDRSDRRDNRFDRRGERPQDRRDNGRDRRTDRLPTPAPTDRPPTPPQ